MEVEQRFPRMQLVRKAAEQYHRLIMDCTRPTLAIHQQQVHNQYNWIDGEMKRVEPSPWQHLEWQIVTTLSGWGIVFWLHSVFDRKREKCWLIFDVTRKHPTAVGEEVWRRSLYLRFLGVKFETSCIQLASVQKWHSTRFSFTFILQFFLLCTFILASQLFILPSYVQTQFAQE